MLFSVALEGHESVGSRADVCIPDTPVPQQITVVKATNATAHQNATVRIVGVRDPWDDMAPSLCVKERIAMMQSVSDWRFGNWFVPSCVSIKTLDRGCFEI